ncbi:MAG: zf-HC2 domain-containing protein [Acidobacteriia bacterium]|nr:zf-HC2 domain-containing protein [Terriglobia bacterium]
MQEQISLFLDRILADPERDGVSAHLETCPACNARFQSLQSTRAALRSIDRVPMPAGLAMQLRVLASHERSRQLARASYSARFRFWAERSELLFENLMRPLALPFAGGLLSALLLFGMLVPSLSFRHNFHDDLRLSIASDPDGRLVESLPGPGSPTWLWTGDSPRMESADFVGSGDETVLELTIDETGRVADYQVSRGRLTPEMQSIILFSRFTPATFNGKNTWGKTQLSFHARRRNVRG